MNPLLDIFPTSLTVGGTEWGIDADYRNCLKIVLAFEDPELTNFEQQSILLGNLYDEIPADVEEAIAKGVEFLNCGELQGGANAGSDRLFSWDKDGKYIYSAIKQTHGLDLESMGYLHWWKFVYLFMDLRESSFFSRIIALRHKRKTGKLTKEERQYCHAIADILELPVAYTPEENEAAAEFLRRLETAK